MLITITVKDAETEQVVPNATLVLSGSDGYGSTKLPGGNGVFTLDPSSYDLPNLSGVTITASAPGYSSVAGNGLALQEENEFLIRKSSIKGPLLIGGGVIAAALILSAGKNKKVAGIDIKKEVLPFVLPVGILVGGLIIYNKVFGDTKEQKQYNDAIDRGIQDAGGDAASYLTDAEIAIMADTLSNDISSFSGQTNTADIINQFDRVYTLVDLLRLIKQYGERWTFLLGIPRGKYDLQESLHQNVSADVINRINSHFANASIQFQF
jgi:hypothetical protein